MHHVGAKPRLKQMKVTAGTAEVFESSVFTLVVLVDEQGS